MTKDEMIEKLRNIRICAPPTQTRMINDVISALSASVVLTSEQAEHTKFMAGLHGVRCDVCISLSAAIDSQLKGESK